MLHAKNYMFLILFRQFTLLFQCFPNGKARFRADQFNAVVKLCNGGSLGIMLIGTMLQLLLIPTEFSIAVYVDFVDETKRTDDGEWHFAHLQQGGHSAETTLVDEVHQRSMDDVVAMMPQGNLVAAKLLRKVEELFAAVPGT